MRRYMGVLSFVVGTLFVMGANEFGFWYLTLFVGLVLGVLPLSAWSRVILSILVGVFGWGATLWLNVGFTNVQSAGRVIGAVMGFGNSGGLIPIVVTLVVGLLLSLAGTWVGRAAYSLVLKNGI